MSRRVVGTARGRTTARVYEGRSPTVNDARLRAPRLLRYIDGGVGKPSLSSVQATVAIAAGVLSVLGGVYSFWQHIKRLQQALKEGSYRLRVSHPRYAAEYLAIHVAPGQTAEVRVELTLSTAGSTPVGEAVDDGVSAVKRFFRSLGGSK